LTEEQENRRSLTYELCVLYAECCTLPLNMIVNRISGEQDT
jgi:hypothetical protein